MAGNVKIGAGIALDGEKEYKQAIASINKEHRVLASEAKKVKSAFDQNNASVKSLTAINKTLNSQIDNQKTKISTLTNALNNAKKNYEDAGKNVEQWKQKLAAAEQEMERMKSSSSTTTEELEQQEKAITELKQSLEQSEKCYQKAGNDVKDWQTSLNNAETGLNKLESEVKENTQAMEKMEDAGVDNAKALKEVEDAADKAGQETLKMGDIIKANLISGAIRDGIKAVANGIKNIAKSVFETGSEFEYGMSEVGAISGATAEEMQALTDKAMEMGAKTKYSAKESADAFKYMGMAGWSAGQMIDGIAGIMDLAAASGEELGTTSDIVTDALSAFGLQASESARFADVLATAATASNTNVGMMGETFKYVAPLAGSLGFSIEDTAVAIGLMANAGVKSSSAGTQLRSAITNLVKPTDQMQAKMDLLGISAINTDGSMKSLREIMTHLRDKMSSMTEAEKEQTAQMLMGSDAAKVAKEEMASLTDEEVKHQTALGLGKEAIKSYDVAQLDSALKKSYSKAELKKMTEEQKRNEVALTQGRVQLEGLTAAEQANAAATIFGKQAMSGWLAIINASEEDFENLCGEIDNSEGAADRMARQMQDNAAGALEEFGGAVETVGIQLYQEFQEPLKEAFKTAAGGVDQLSASLAGGKLNTSVKKLSTSFEDLSKKTVGFAVDTVPKLIDGATWIIDNGGAITSTIGGIAAGVTAVKTVSTGIKLAGAIKETAEAAKVASTATATFTSILANPYAAAIGGVVVGLTALTAWQMTHGQKLDEQTQKTKDLIKESGTLMQTVEDSRAGRENSNATTEAEIALLKMQKDELLELNDKEQLNNTEKAKMKDLVKALNETMPNLNLEIDTQTGHLKGNADELERNVKNMESFMRVQAASAMSQDILEEQLKLEMQLNDAKEQQGIAIEDVTKKEKAHNDARKEYGEYDQKTIDKLNELATSRNALNALDDTVLGLEKSISESEKEYKKLTDTVADDQAVLDAAESADTLRAAYDQAAAGIEESGGKIGKSTKKNFNEAVKNAEEAGVSIPSGVAEGLANGTITIAQATKKINNEIKKAGEEAVKESKADAKKIPSGMADEITSGASKAETASKTLKKNIVTPLNELPKEAGTAGEKTNIKLSDAISKGEKKPVAAMTVVSGAILEAAKSKNGEYNGVGRNMMDGAENGISSKLPAVVSTMKSAATSILKAAKDTLGIKSPSKAFEKEVGEWIPKGIEKGIANNKKYAKKSASEMAKEILSASTSWLDKYKVYHEVSLADEVYYWNKIRKECKKGTDARVEADKKYYESKKSLNEKLASLERTYADNVKKVNDDLKNNIKSLTDAYNNSVTSRTATITSSMNIFDTFEAKTDKTGKQLLANIESQVQGLTDWTNNLDALAERGLDTGLIEELQALGPSASGEIAALNQLTDEELEKYVELWRSKSALATGQATKELEPLKAETEASIKELQKTAKKEITAYAKELKKAAKELGVTLDVAVELAQPTEEVKATMKTQGSVAVKSLASGVKTESAKKGTIKKIQAINETVNATIAPLTSDSYTIGQQIVQGVIKGVDSRTKELEASMRAMVTAAANAAKAAADIHSPSRLFEREIGEQMAAGVGVGFENRMNQVNDMIAQMIPASANTVNKEVYTTTTTNSPIFTIYANGLGDAEIKRITKIINRELGMLI